jgi:ribonuclease HI
MKLTPTAAMEVLLNLTPLDLLTMAEARMALYKLHILKQQCVPKTVSGLLTIWKNVGDPLLDMLSDYIIPVYCHTKNFMVIIDQEYQKNKDPVFPDDALIRFTDRSRADSGTGAGIYSKRPDISFSFPLGIYANVFQTKIYATLQCACENIRRAYKHKWILIFSDSQVTLQALSSPKVTPGLVAECLDALSALASRNKVTLKWVPGHCGIPGTEKVDKLARQSSYAITQPRASPWNT